MGDVMWTEQAVADLRAVHDFIARDAAAYAELLIEEILERVEQLPEAGSSPIPEAGNEPIHEMSCRGFRVLYRQQAEEIQVLALCPARSD